MNVSSLSGGVSAYTPNSSSLGIPTENALSQGAIQGTAQKTDLKSSQTEYADRLDLSPEALGQEDRASITDLWKKDAAARYLQLGNSIQGSDKAYFKRFDITIEMTEKDIEQRISSLLEESGIELGESERFDIHIDADGVINVTLPEGEGSEERAEEIATVLNADETLTQEMLRLKATRNSRDSLLGLEPTESLQGGILLGKAIMPDIATRTFLAEDYLQREFELSLDILSIDASNNLTITGQEGSDLERQINENIAIQEEIVTVLQSDSSDLEFTADYSFGDGVLLDSEETSEANISENLRDLFTATGTVNHPALKGDINNNLAEAISVYNSTALDEHKISNFSIVADEQGRLSIEGEFVSGERLGTAKAMIESWLTPTFETLMEVTTDAIFKKHDAEHGDVDEYKHEVVLEVDNITGITAEVRSEEADLAALKDIAEATIDVATSLGQFVQETFREAHDEMTEDRFETIFSEPVDIYIDENGSLSVDESTIENEGYLQMIRETLSVLNDLLSDEEVETSESSGAANLPKELRPVFDLLKQIQSDMDRIHDRSLCSVHFSFSG